MPSNDNAREQLPYDQSHYLLFGTQPSEAYAKLDCEGAATYLRECGFAGNSLTQARKRGLQSDRYAGYRDPDAHYCDFCCKMLTGSECEVLRDGRERCVECSETVLTRLEDYEALFAQTRDGLCVKYGINISIPVHIKVVSQAKMSKMQGSKFVPTKYFDPRAVGLAQRNGNEYSMFFENGSPKASLTATAAHELTHIWQYTHWDWQAMEQKYGKFFLAVCEGMAKWSEIQYMYLLNETAYADRHLANEVMRTDVYGYGLRLYLNQYPLSKDILRTGPSPFDNPNEPVEIG